MRRILAASFIALATLLACASSASAPAAEDGPGTETRGVVRVYYFHTTQRCASCRKIEALADEAIRTGFQRELADGRLEWLAVNTDEAPNKHFLADYKLYTKSVVVVDLRNPSAVRWKNLPKIWELLHDEAGFRKYVHGELKAYLDGAP
jgi:hypothetical protein